MLLVFFILVLVLLVTLRFEIYIKDNIKIKIYVLNIFKIAQFKIKKEKLNIIQSKNFEKIKNYNKKEILKKVIKNKSTVNLVKILEIKKLNLKIEIGIEEILLLIYIIPIISTFLSIIYSVKKIEGNYEIKPIYNKNIFKIDLDCIVSIKMIHIINIVWKLMRKKVGKNERTSNRRTYAYGHE